MIEKRPLSNYGFEKYKSFREYIEIHSLKFKISFGYTGWFIKGVAVKILVFRFSRKF